MHKKKEILDKINNDLNFLDNESILFLNKEGGNHKERILNYVEKTFNNLMSDDFFEKIKKILLVYF